MRVWSRVNVAVIAALMVAGCADGPASPGFPLAGTILEAEELVSVRTAWSGYETAAYEVITNAADWAQAWERIYGLQSPKPTLPAVDFDRHVVVLAAMGTRPSTGYSVTITDVRLVDGTLHIRVVERAPGPTCATGDAITSPLHAVQVARHPAAPRFYVVRETVRC